MIAWAKRRWRILAGSAAGLLLLFAITAVVVLRSEWFRELVRERIVQGVETATGGRVELSAFHMEWSGLRVELDGFILHGLEPAGVRPLFQAPRITADLTFLSLFRKIPVEIASIELERPQGNVMVFPDGSTNVPKPKTRSPGGTPALETFVNLAIGRFQIQDGTVQFDNREMPLAAQGENLHVVLNYRAVQPAYTGTLSIGSVFLQQGNHPRLNLAVNLPLAIEKDRIALDGATVSTAQSRVSIRATITNLKSPRVTGDVAGQIDIPEIAQSFGWNVQPVDGAAPRLLTLDLRATSDDGQFLVPSANFTLGGSRVAMNAHFGNLSLQNGAAEFEAHLDVKQLARWVKNVDAGGTVTITGKATIPTLAGASAQADVAGEGLSFSRDSIQVAGASLNGHLNASRSRIDLTRLLLEAAGGQVSAQGRLENLARYQLRADLSGFDVQELVRMFAAKSVAWGAALSGPVEVSGNLKGPALQTAEARLTLAPNGRGIPLRGEIQTRYDQPTDSFDVGQSFVTLPSSRLDFTGSINSQMNVRVTSSNLKDFEPALGLAVAQPERFLPVQLMPGGSLALNATVTGSLRQPVIAGNFNLRRFQAQDRRFDSLTAQYRASAGGVSLDQAVLSRGDLHADLQMSLGLSDWKAPPSSPLSANVVVRNADVADLLALANRRDIPVTGPVTLTVQAGGTLGNWNGQAQLEIRKGSAYGEPLDLVQTHADLAGRRITVPYLRVNSGDAHLDANATFEHAPDSFTTGQLQAHAEASQIALGKLNAVQKRSPGLQGDIRVNLDGTLTVNPASAQDRIQIDALNGTIRGDNLSKNGKALGQLEARVNESGNAVRYQVNSNFGGSDVKIDGRTVLTGDFPTTANVNLRDVPVEDVLEILGRGHVPAVGQLSVSGNVSGTAKSPAANLDFTLRDAKDEDQHIDRATGHVNYSGTQVDIPNLAVQAGPNRADLTAEFTHPERQFDRGDLTLSLRTNTVQMESLPALVRVRNGLHGALAVDMKTAATVRPPQPGAQRIQVTALEGSLTATRIQVNSQDAGDLQLTATQSGPTVDVKLVSTVAGADIRGSIQTQLAADYPMTAQLDLRNVLYENFAHVFNGTRLGQSSFDVAVDGQVRLNGPALHPAAFNGSVQFSKMNVFTVSHTNLTGSGRVLVLENDVPVVAAVQNGTLRIQRAHWGGPTTDVSLDGTIAYDPALRLDLSTNGKVDLALLQKFDGSVSSEGNVTLAAAIKGPPASPSITGRLELKNAAFQTEAMPVGISKANSVVVFNGNLARIESFTAESGGGRVTASGSVSRANHGVRFDLRARAQNVHVRTAVGASATANANVQLNGSNENSLLSGNVDIRSVGFAARSDFGSILTRTAAPVETPAAPQGLLANMKLDINVRMGAGTLFQTLLAQNLEASADLNLRGTVTHPGMLGRVSVTSGQLIFFGTKYTVNEGDISFYNPFKIEPVLNLNLSTAARGVSVSLTVSGPAQNMNLTYQSDPPLPFNEIVNLLATGRAPTSDPVLLSSQPATPAQTLPQMGASALLGAAVANPISGQLQRVFGVSQLKIDPTFTSGSELPQARLTLQQQVSQQLTFTYITNLSRSDQQSVRVEWMIDPNWSAIASRQENGIVAVELFYKRRFE